MDKSLSAVIPFYNEEENVESVLREIMDYYPDIEIIAVDDGSRDGTWEKIKKIDRVRKFRFEQNRGQSAAVYFGLKQASREYCVIMDGDGQNDPADIMTLFGRAGEADVVCGFRKDRKDTWRRRVSSVFANALRRSILDDKVRDTGCALKLFRHELVECLVPFSGMHRYLPALFLNSGYTVIEVPVNHRPRQKGVSKYNNWKRAIRGMYDLVGVSWLLRRKINYNKLEITVSE